MSSSWLSSEDQLRSAEALPHTAFPGRNLKLLKHSSTQLHAVQAQQVLVPHVPKSYCHNLQPPTRAMCEVMAIFPKLPPPNNPLYSPPSRAPVRLLASLGQLLTTVCSFKPVSDPSLAGTTCTLTCPAALLGTRPSPAFSC